MKKIMAFALTAVMTLALLVGCGNKPNNDANTGDDNANGGTVTETVSGTVSTDGSTSMEKVIGALSESYMAANKDVTVNYNPTGSGSGITAVQEGTCDIGLSSRALKDEEKAGGVRGEKKEKRETDVRAGVGEGGRKEEGGERGGGGKKWKKKKEIYPA